MPPQNKAEEAAVCSDDDIQDAKFANGSCCFWMPCNSAVGPIWWQHLAMHDNDNDTDSESSTPSSDNEAWWTRGWRRFREWSELVAGPKWKTFVRRFKSNGTGNGGGKFHYDPLSYALNFDEGPGRNGYYDDEYFRRNFSFRYATLPLSTKPSLDFDKEEPLLVWQHVICRKSMALFFYLT